MSIQNEIGKDRKPRVHLTYQVEVGDSFKTVDIPFVVGVMADLSGARKQPLGDLKADSRRFVTINRNTFEDVIAKVAPRLEFAVPNTLQTEGKSLKVDMELRSMDDFGPDRVIENVPALKALAETRRQLQELSLKVGGNAALDKVLQDAIANTESLSSLHQAVVDGGDIGQKASQEKTDE